MRDYDDIIADINAANSLNDNNALRILAQEMSELGTSKAEAAALNVLGVVFLNTSDYPKALDHLRRSLPKFEELEDSRGISGVRGNLGNTLARIGDFAAALDQYRLALAIHEEQGDVANVARSFGNMGMVYLSTGDYLIAMEHYRRALDISEELGDRVGAALQTGNIGGVYIGTGDYPSALQHYRQALAVMEELGDRASVAIITGNIGLVHQGMGDNAAALEHYHRSLALHEEFGSKAGVANVYGNIGYVHAEAGEYSSALEYHRRALTMNEELGDRASVTINTVNIIEALLGLNQDAEAEMLLETQAGMHMDAPNLRALHFANKATLAEHAQDLETTREHLLQALTIVTEAGARSAAAEYHQKLRDLSQRRNDFAGFIEHNAEFLRITEEIRGKEATQRLTMMEADRRMEAERRERDKERALLYGTLPESVATRILRGEKVSGDHYDAASVIFLDIVGFTSISDKIPPGHVVHLLSQIFSTLDAVCKKHSVTKIKTIGDSYMAVAGVPDVQDDHAQRAATCALDMLAALDSLEVTMPPDLGDTSWTKDVGDIRVRIGVHCGPVTAGVIGTERLQYDVWGDTVNVASRMESTSEPSRIHVSEVFSEALVNGNWHLAFRGATEVKGKGTIQTYWLESV